MKLKKSYTWILILILLGFVLSGIFISIAPDRIPAHYNIRGEVDRWGSKLEFIIFPVANLVFGGFMAWLARYEGKHGRDMNERVVASMTVMILILFNAQWTIFMCKAVDLSNPGGNLGELPAKLITVLLCATFIPLGNIMPKAERNSLFGLRTKWSMANDRCWQQSQRFAGYAFVITGILGVVVCSLLPAQWGGYAMLALLLAMTLLCTCASYRIYRKDQETGKP
ncbi:MAG: DUF1648 domain-containing protein [Ruminococcaceae bacterium]|nr:DUF1648 domain-containing protein [Oscillospiraceae bacterium]